MSAVKQEHPEIVCECVLRSHSQDWTAAEWLQRWEEPKLLMGLSHSIIKVILTGPFLMVFFPKIISQIIRPKLNQGLQDLSRLVIQVKSRARTWIWGFVL
jgi:hypothetical protein